MNTPNITRRRSIALTGTTIATAGAGLYLGTERAGAQASVELGTLDVAGGEFAPEDGELWGLWALIEGAYEYSVDAQPVEWECFLLVYDGGGNSEAIGVTAGAADAQTGSGTYALRGDIAASSFWGPSDFRVPDGETSVTVEVPLEVAFLVRDADGTMLVQDRAADTAPVTVTSDGEVMAAVGGTGEFVAVDDHDDPTPSGD